MTPTATYVLQPLPHPSRANCCAAIQNAVDGMEVEIRAKGKKRSKASNRFYWRMLNQIAEDAWLEGRRYAANVWHHFYRMRFLGVIDGPCGTSFPISTSDLEQNEFNEYVRKVEVHAASELFISFTDLAEPTGRIK